ncbi:MAG: autotransporter outer membrane beta-barrel domain-containing protein [Selenomonadaceae bacterium]|nr:autotransporter outer membrane beta-barrel domain-containing protein [Selenomonadaceae bacterium]
MKLMTGLKKKQICAAIAFGLIFTMGGQKAEATATTGLHGATVGKKEIKDGSNTLAKADNETTHIAESNDASNSLESGAEFTVLGGEWKNVYGGIGNSTDATANNKITISGGTVELVVVGGDAGTSTSAVTKNIVNIGGSASVNYAVYGGRDNCEGECSNAEVKSNEVNINGGTVKGNIYGGFAKGGNATDNEVVIANIKCESVDVYGALYIVGGLSDKYAKGNSVTIKGGTFTSTKNGHTIQGGSAGAGTATENTVTIEGGTFDSYVNIYGGKGKTGASGNIVNISRDVKFDAQNEASSKNGVLQALHGGHSVSGAASNNVINISGGSITGTGTGLSTSFDYGIAGGFVSGGVGMAENNVVNISGGEFKDIRIFGAWGQVGTNNNTVNISGGSFDNVSVFAVGAATTATCAGSNNNVNLIGVGGKLNGISHSGAAFSLGTVGSGSGSGNILNITGTDTTVTNVTGFANVNFVITSAMANGATMLTIDEDAATDLSGAAVSVKAEAGANLQADTKINLVHKTKGGALELPAADKITIQKSGVSASYAEVLKTALEGTEENDLVLNVKESISIAENGELGANAKNMVETRAAGMAVVNEAVDFVTGQGMGQAKLAAKAATKEGSRSLAPFASVGGGNMRYNSGSHVDSKSWHGTVGLAKEIGDLTVGLAINHGSSSYDSYNAGGVHGSGSSKSTGVTVMAEVSRENGVHYDAALQAGRLKNDYSANLSGYDTSYDESSNYYGLSLGGGKEFTISDKEKVDVYGRYYWSHTNSSDTTTNTGDRLSFDAVNSHRLRLGGRYTRTVNDMSRLYAGLAWQYEFNGDARAVINGQGAPSPSLKGHSAMLELGWKADVAKNLAIDLNVSGWTGKQRGVTGSLGLKWMF